MDPVVVAADSADPPAKSGSATVAALRSRDPEEFRALVSELNPGMLRLAGMYLSTALAEEVVQDTWVAVVNSIDSFKEHSSLKTWIYHIMMNKVRTLAVREAKIIPFASLGHTDTDDTPSVDPDRLVHASKGPGNWAQPLQEWDIPAHHVEQVELLEHVSAALERLTIAQREVVELRDVQGWAAHEVCSTLGISSVNQRVLLHRGRAAIRGRLEEYLTNE